MLRHEACPTGHPGGHLIRLDKKYEDQRKIILCLHFNQ